MRVPKVLLSALLTLAFAAPASALSLQKGSSILAVSLSRGVADVVDIPNPLAPGEPLRASNHSEIGGSLQYWYFLAEEYGVSLSGGIGYFKEKDTSGDPLSSDVDYTFNSWNVRLGGDRFAKLTDKLALFAGPGIEIWSGKWKFETSGSEEESPATTRISLSGRMGAHISLGESIGLVGHLGQYWGYATSEEVDGAKTKWLPSGTEGAVGFAFGF